MSGYKRRRKSGRRFTLEVNSKLMFDARGKPTGVHSIARDISERKEAEARQAVLVRELQHRTKNMLAVIQSIATSTLSRSKDLGSAQEALIGRLHALAHAQEFVAAGPGGGVPLRDLVEGELSAFGARTIINGEPHPHVEITWAGLAALSYLPATAAPIGLIASGLPVGLQIIGPEGEDLTTIEFARLLAREIGGFTPPPGYE